MIRKKAIKTIAAGLLFTFLTQEASLAIPEAGVWKEIHHGEKEVWIIHLQDAHSNLGGQENLAAELDELMRRYGTDLVLVEGGSQDDSLTPLKPLAPPAVWKRVAKKFLIEGKIAGEEYLNLVSDRPMRIQGIEDKALYFEGLAGYAELAGKREKILASLEKIKAAVQKLKQDLYPVSLLRYELKKSPEEFFLLAKENRMDLGEFPRLCELEENFSRFSKAFNITDKKEVEAYLERYSKIDFGAVLDEWNTAEKKLYEAVLPAGDPKLLRGVDRWVRLLESAYRIEISQTEFNTLQKNRPDFGALSVQAFLNRRLAERGHGEDLVPYETCLEEGEVLLARFYDSAARRDEAFIKNTEKALAGHRQKTAVLIAGGYHTANLTRLFREKGWSYRVFAPRITSETNRAKYEKILLAPLLKRQIGGAGFAPPSHAAGKDTIVALKLMEPESASNLALLKSTALGAARAARNTGGGRLADRNTTQAEVAAASPSLVLQPINREDQHRVGKLLEEISPAIVKLIKQVQLNPVIGQTVSKVLAPLLCQLIPEFLLGTLMKPEENLTFELIDKLHRDVLRPALLRHNWLLELVDLQNGTSWVPVGMLAKGTMRSPDGRQAPVFFAEDQYGHFGHAHASLDGIVLLLAGRGIGRIMEFVDGAHKIWTQLGGNSSSPQSISGENYRRNPIGWIYLRYYSRQNYSPTRLQIQLGPILSSFNLSFPTIVWAVLQDILVEELIHWDALQYANTLGISDDLISIARALLQKEETLLRRQLDEAASGKRQELVARAIVEAEAALRAMWLPESYVSSRAFVVANTLDDESIDELTRLISKMFKQVLGKGKVKQFLTSVVEHDPISPLVQKDLGEMAEQAYSRHFVVRKQVNLSMNPGGSSGSWRAAAGGGRPAASPIPIPLERRLKNGTRLAKEKFEDQNLKPERGLTGGFDSRKSLIEFFEIPAGRHHNRFNDRHFGFYLRDIRLKLFQSTRHAFQPVAESAELTANVFEYSSPFTIARMFGTWLGSFTFSHGANLSSPDDDVKRISNLSPKAYPSMNPSMNPGSSSGLRQGSLIESPSAIPARLAGGRPQPFALENGARFAQDAVKKRLDPSTGGGRLGSESKGVPSGPVEVTPNWDAPIQDMLDRLVHFLPERMQEEGFVYRAIAGGLKNGLMSGLFTSQGKFSAGTWEDPSEFTRGIYYVSHYLSEAVHLLTHLNLLEAGNDAAIFVIRSSFFNSELLAKRAAIHANAYGRYRFPFFTKPIPLERISYLLVRPGVKAHLALPSSGATKIFELPDAYELISNGEDIPRYFRETHEVDFSDSRSVPSPIYPHRLSDPLFDAMDPSMNPRGSSGSWRAAAGGGRPAASPIPIPLERRLKNGARLLGAVGVPVLVLLIVSRLWTIGIYPLVFVPSIGFVIGVGTVLISAVIGMEWVSHRLARRNNLRTQMTGYQKAVTLPTYEVGVEEVKRDSSGARSATETRLMADVPGSPRNKVSIFLSGRQFLFDQTQWDSIRPAEPEDAEQVYALSRFIGTSAGMKVFQNASAVRSMVQRLGTNLVGESVMYVYKPGGQVLGYIQGRVDRNSGIGIILQVAVSPVYQKRGVATMLNTKWMKVVMDEYGVRKFLRHPIHPFMEIIAVKFGFERVAGPDFIARLRFYRFNMNDEETYRAIAREYLFYTIHDFRIGVQKKDLNEIGQLIRSIIPVWCRAAKIHVGDPARIKNQFVGQGYSILNTIPDLETSIDFLNFLSFSLRPGNVRWKSGSQLQEEGYDPLEDLSRRIARYWTDGHRVRAEVFNAAKNGDLRGLMEYWFFMKLNEGQQYGLEEKDLNIARIQEGFKLSMDGESVIVTDQSVDDHMRYGSRFGAADPSTSKESTRGARLADLALPTDEVGKVNPMNSGSSSGSWRAAAEGRPAAETPADKSQSVPSGQGLVNPSMNPGSSSGLRRAGNDLISGKGELADPDAGVFDNRNRRNEFRFWMRFKKNVEMFLDRSRSRAVHSEKDDAWLVGMSKGQDGRKIQAHRQNNPAFFGGTIQDHFIGSPLKSDVSGVDRVKTPALQPSRGALRDGHVDQEFHFWFVWLSGDGERLFAREPRRIFKRFVNILSREVGIIFENLALRLSAGQKIQDKVDRYAKPSETGSPSEGLGIKSDSAEVERLGLVHSRPKFIIPFTTRQFAALTALGARNGDTILNSLLDPSMNPRG
ncbi:MAG: GNAT family N-acetyltransferase [Candidatus Omnitrophica bacterium]|nr:GNAT family N-acetyltransferase [Candidatus Omnitrophota bacterium]